MRTLAKAALLALAALWVYQPCLSGGWLWDDGLEVARNAAVHAATGWWTPWVRPEGMDYFPLKGTLVWVEWRLWGDATLGYHLVNLGLHILSALLVWRLLALLGAGWAYLGGLLFAVHPLCVESVAWISEFKNTSSQALVLLSAVAFVRAEASGSRRLWAASLAAFVAALLCKTSVVMIPLVLAGYLLWRRGRITRSGARRIAPFLAASLVLGLVTVWFQSQRAIGAGAAPLPLGVRLAQAGRSIAAYAGLGVWPSGLEPVYPADPALAGAVLAWIGLGAVLGVAWAARATWGRHALLGLGWYLLNLAPVLGVIPMSYSRISPRADHFAYLPLVGLVGLGAAGLGALPSGVWRRGVAVLGAAAVVLLAVQARGYAARFSSEASLWSYAVERNPGAWLAHNNLGKELMRQGDVPGAQVHFERAVALKPDSPEAHANLGNALAARGLGADAAAQYRAAIALEPGFAGAHYDLGVLLLRTRAFDEAETELRRDLAVRPGHAEGHNNLGLSLAGQGRGDEAMAEYGKALALDPSLPEAHLNRGNLLFRRGNPGDAAREYREALRADPGYRPAHANLAKALEALGREDEARLEAEAAKR